MEERLTPMQELIKQLEIIISNRNKQLEIFKREIIPIMKHLKKNNNYIKRKQRNYLKKYLK